MTITDFTQGNIVLATGDGDLDVAALTFMVIQTAADREAACRARLREAIHGIVGSNGYAALTVERATTIAHDRLLRRDRPPLRQLEHQLTDLAGLLIGGHRVEDRGRRSRRSSPY